jgi:hypothetical protein
MHFALARTRSAQCAPAQLLDLKRGSSVRGRGDVCAAVFAPVICGGRRLSRKPTVGVILGGLPFSGRADLVVTVETQCGASDAQRAAIEARKLLASRERV